MAKLGRWLDISPLPLRGRGVGGEGGIAEPEFRAKGIVIMGIRIEDSAEQLNGND
jgi:hypothetical protein